MSQIIESLIRRKGGTTVTLGPVDAPRTYKFVSTPPDPRHLCTVSNDDDVDTLVAIKEGYRLARAAGASVAPPAPPKQTDPDGMSVVRQGGKWYVTDKDAKPVSEGFDKKSEADAALAKLEKASGE